MANHERTSTEGSVTISNHDAGIPIEQLSQQNERQNQGPVDDSSSMPQRDQPSKDPLQERIDRLEARLQDIQSPPVLLAPGPAFTSYDSASDVLKSTATGWGTFPPDGILRRTLRVLAVYAFVMPYYRLWDLCYAIRVELLPDYQGRDHCARYYGEHQFGKRISQADHIGSNAAPIYLIIGVFNREDMVPNERFAQITRPRRLFWTMSYHIMRLRRMGGIFSLKDVKKFRIYKVICFLFLSFPFLSKGSLPASYIRNFAALVDMGISSFYFYYLLINGKQGLMITQCAAFSHQRVHLQPQDERTLHDLFSAYRSWSFDRTKAREWTSWIHQCLNKDSVNPSSDPDDAKLAIEVVLGWSAVRITILICMPIALSLVVGFWIMWDDPSDLSRVQTAWTVASYVVTASARECLSSRACFSNDRDLGINMTLILATVLAVLVGLVSNTAD